MKLFQVPAELLKLSCVVKDLIKFVNSEQLERILLHEKQCFSFQKFVMDC